MRKKKNQNNILVDSILELIRPKGFFLVETIIAMVCFLVCIVIMISGVLEKVSSGESLIILLMCIFLIIKVYEYLNKLDSVHFLSLLLIIGGTLLRNVFVSKLGIGILALGYIIAIFDNIGGKVNEKVMEKQGREKSRRRKANKGSS